MNGGGDGADGRPPTSVVPAEKQPTPPPTAQATRPTVVMPPELPAELKRFLVSYEEQSSGFLPPPTMLNGYSKVFPGCAERIVGMAEEEGHHRRAMEKSGLQAEISAGTRIAYFIFIAALLALWAGTYLLLSDKKLEGFGVILTPILTALGNMWISKRKGGGDTPKPTPASAPPTAPPPAPTPAKAATTKKKKKR